MIMMMHTFSIIVSIILTCFLCDATTEKPPSINFILLYSLPINPFIVLSIIVDLG